MKTLGPGMGPSSKLDLLSQARSPDLGAKKEFSDLVRERTPIARGESTSKAPDSRRDKPDELRPDDRQNDSRPVKVESKGKSSKNADNAKTEKTEVRKKAMLQFMDSMENEFGITPARMLEAMAQVDSEEMTLAPEDTASQVIENLDLPLEDQPQAMALYSSFVNLWRELQDNQTAQAVPTAESMPQMAAGTGGFFAGRDVLKTDAMGKTAAKLQPITSGKMQIPEGMVPMDEIPLSAQEKRALLNDSLDQMNARFFVTPESKLPEAQVLPADLMNRTANMNAAAAEEALPAFTQDESGLYAAKTGAGESAFNFGALAGLTGLGALLPGKAEVGSEHALGKSLESASEGESPMAVLMADVKSATSSGKESESESFDSETSGDTASLDAGPQDLAKFDGARGDFGQMLKGNGIQGGAAMAAGAGLSPRTVADQKAALEALKDQTQIMVAKGGGEAKITFNQEGLGEISLKVTVHEGKVNVEMGAETQEAKKLLESSLGDLKSSLAQHKLSVDQVRVDVGSSGLSDQNKQQGMNFGQDMGRDQARQMMQQFRDETAGRRDPFFEMSGVKAYAKKMPGPAPIPAAADRAINRYTGEGRGDRMNLVA